MKRTLAIAGAVLMIVLAIIIRSAIDNGSSSSSPSSPSTGKVVCITELAEQCRAIGVDQNNIEDASVTAKALAKGTADIDAWITLDPWPEVVNQLAKRQVMDPGNRVARTDLLIAMVDERATRLAPTCGGTVNWKCVGDAIGRQWTDFGGPVEWGPVKAGIPPTTTAEGLLLLGHAASGYFGSSTFATNDFNDDFIVWKSKVTGTPASYTTFIQQFPAAFSAVGATRVEVTSGSGTRPVAKIDGVPSADAVAVIAPVAGRSAPGSTKGLKDQLRAAGWSTDALNDPTGLPDAGVLLALSGLTG